MNANREPSTPKRSSVYKSPPAWWWIWPLKSLLADQELRELAQRDFEAQLETREREAARSREIQLAQLERLKALTAAANAKREFIARVEANLSRLHQQRESNLAREAEVIQRWSALADRIERLVDRAERRENEGREN